MSTICVVKKDGRTCLAADTLTCFGSTKESAKYIREGGKIVRHGENIIGVVGHASLDLILRAFFAENDASFDSKPSILRTMLHFHQFLKDECYLNAEEADLPFETSRVHLLIANKHGIFGVYDLRSIQEYSRFYAFGSGDSFALGAMYAVYDSALSAESIAEVGVRAACEFDQGSGEPIEIESV